MRTLLVLCCLLISPLYANKVIVEGKILSVQRYQLINEPSPYMQMIVRTNRNEDMVVELGPIWFFKIQGFFFSPSSAVTVKGQLIERKGRKFLIANEIKKGKVSLNLRDEQGNPLWLSWRNEA